MNQDEWGTWLMVLLIVNLIVTTVAAALISKHHKDTVQRGTTIHRDVRP